MKFPKKPKRHYHLIRSVDLKNLKNVYWNLHTPELYERILANKEGMVSHIGPMVVSTGKFTGRSPNDKFIVKDEETEGKINWGKVNVSYDPVKFDAMFEKIKAYLQNREVYALDAYAGTDAKYRMPVRIITELAWHNLFARNMFVLPAAHDELDGFEPAFNVIDVARFKGDPDVDSLNSETFILVNFKKRIVLIGGTEYGGEIKKSIFSVLNYYLPQQNVLPMHCSANIGKEGDTALFFGLSGTGKTTLSADPDRALIGDDEHGWSEDGVFNFEGGCYAKVIRLSKEAEPAIYKTTRMFGTILENVVVDPDSRFINLDDDTLTENTRASYPITHLDNIVIEGKGGHPNNIIFLTADAFGVLPPISKLTPSQAMYQFLLGYTAKVAGTERGVTEPQATFSTCFGAPFMPLHPSRYAELLGQKINEHNATCWLVNTGWTGGPYGEGQRISIKYTRALLNAALQGTLKDVEFEKDPYFGLSVPKSCAGVPAEVLMPKNTWKDKDAYDQKARNLAGLFIENFKKYEDKTSDEIKNAGPVV
ncbi:MAG: phosphoenolpyruvate carboxykinase (ATP) [Deferribacteres bacterium]|nr:phosphoenolpyruvate carboxykinase (ATP) [candidate division KSB1 bacterium]MCB9501088.1 phosphoenolpyruvate carboxykinase (ATP) [Deferribacteres bacterium]